MIRKTHKVGNSGIYKISSQIKPERFYIGSSCNLRTRRNKHFLDLAKNIHHSHKLQRHYNKYGKTDISFEIIEKCDPDVLLEREQYYLSSINPYFNECPCATSRKGVEVSDETKKKQSKSRMGKEPWNKGKRGYKVDVDRSNPSDELRNKISLGLKKYYAEHPEAREHLSKLAKAQPRDLDKLREMSRSRKGHVVTQETRDKISKANKGRKIGKTKRIYKVSEETKEKLRKANLGKKRSPKSLKRQSYSLRKVWAERRAAS